MGGWPATDGELLNLKGPESIEGLAVSSQLMSDKSLVHFGRVFPYLMVVRVYSGDITAAGVAELKRLLPHVHVGWREDVLSGVEDKRGGC